MERTVLSEIAELRGESKNLALSSDRERREALLLVAAALLENKEYIFSENKRDRDSASSANLSASIAHRLKFDEEKLRGVVKGLEELAELPDPIGHIRERRELDKGLILEKRTYPIGVIGMIFESRPDALVQIAGLSLRSGNGIILKGGREAVFSNRALVKVIKEALSATSIGGGWIMLLESHSDVNELLKADKYVDLLIPRGSNSFVRYVIDNTRIPVIGHADGICSIFVDESADQKRAVEVIVDAKTNYPAACNAVETILVSSKIAEEFLPPLSKALRDANVTINADSRAINFMDARPASEDAFDREYLSLECAVKVVDSLEEAIDHINSHGSHHTDAIITASQRSADSFVNAVDSADVFVNCSTRFADGFRFGLGAEVGISTSKIHARGPVGLEGLVTTKWILNGSYDKVSTYTGPNAKSFTHKELL